MNKTCELSIDLIDQAIDFLNEKIIKTPIEYSPVLSDLVKSPVYLKMESLQLTGSFKVRGAYFYLSTLDQSVKQSGVAACSAGNHGLGVAFASRLLGIPCTVYVPSKIDEVKKANILRLGAEIKHSAFIGYDDTLAWAKDEAIRNQQHLISAFEDERIMAGNGGTIAAEILSERRSVKNVLFPVGGGGLGGGICYYMKAKAPEVRLIGCQLEDSPALKLSLDTKKAVTSLPPIETIAGGLEGGLGELCFDLLKDRIDSVSLVSENEIKQAVRWLLQNHQHLAEPSAIAAVAACLAQKTSLLKGETVILITGRNVSFSTLQKIIAP